MKKKLCIFRFSLSLCLARTVLPSLVHRVESQTTATCLTRTRDRRANAQSILLLFSIQYLSNVYFLKRCRTHISSNFAIFFVLACALPPLIFRFEHFALILFFDLSFSLLFFIGTRTSLNFFRSATFDSKKLDAK